MKIIIFTNIHIIFIYIIRIFQYLHIFRKKVDTLQTNPSFSLYSCCCCRISFAELLNWTKCLRIQYTIFLASVPYTCYKKNPKTSFCQQLLSLESIQGLSTRKPLQPFRGNLLLFQHSTINLQKTSKDLITFCQGFKQGNVLTGGKG